MDNAHTVFSTAKTIAVVGISDNPEKYSWQVASYLQSRGFRIIPVNPNVTLVLGETAYPSLHAIPRDIHVDVADIFRKSEFVPDHVREAIDRGDISTIWLQEGVSNQEAEKTARDHGLTVISNMCMMKSHKADTSRKQQK